MRRRALVSLARGAQSVGFVAAFAGSLVGGVWLHTNTPVFRRLAATISNEALATRFDGKIVVRDVQSISLGETSRVRVREAEVIDPAGHRVILANDVDATIDLRRLLESLATTGAPNVELDEVRVGRAEIVLDVDPAGAPWIARTFHSSKTPAAPTPSLSGGPLAPARAEPRVNIAKVRLGEARIHGNLVPPSLDGDTRDLRGAFRFEHQKAEITLDHGRVTLRSPKLPELQKAPIVGDVRGRLGIDLASTPSVFDGNAKLEGSCGRVPLVAEAKVAGEQVEATIDIARTEPNVLATAFEGLPLTKPIEVHARASGKFAAINVTARARVGESNLDAKGELDLREGKAFKLEVDAAHVDAQAFGASVATDLSGKVSGAGNLSGGAGPLGTFRVVTTEGTVGTEKIPATTIEGRFESKQVTAVLRAHEAGADATGKITLDVPSKVATFDIQARSSSLRAVARAPKNIGGSATARVQGKVDLDKQTIRATATAAGEGISVDVFSARHLDARGTISGPLGAPVLDTSFSGVDLQLKANDKAPLVYPHATGHAKIALVPTPQILDASVDVGQAGSPENITASAKGVRFANGNVEARGLRVTGLGEPLELDVDMGNGQWRIRAKSSGLALQRAAGVTGIKELALLPEDTRASVDVDLHQGSEGADGHLDVVVRSAKGLGSGAISAEAHATASRGKLVGTTKLVAEGFGQIEVTRAELDVPKRLDARSLQRTTGVVEIRGSVDLAQGAALFAGERVERVAGVGSFEARIERGDPDALPMIRGTARTDGLEIALTGEPPSMQTTEIAGIDLLTHVAWDGHTEDAEVSLLSWDKHGVLATAGAKAKVPLAAWITGAKKLDAKALASLNVRAIADIPARDITQMPSFLEAPMLRGRVDSHVEIAGSIGKPSVTVSAHARGVREDRRGRGDTASFEPLDGTLEARWDGQQAAITFALDERQRRQRRPPPKPGPRAPNGPPPPRARQQTPGHLRGLVLMTDLRVSDLLDGRPVAKLPWRASAEIEVENLALAAVPISTPMSGLLTGRARIRELNHDASFEAKAHVDDFGTGGATVESVDLTAGGRDASLFAHASVVDQQSQATIQLASKSLRVKGLDVSWEPMAPTRLDYAVQNGRLALLAPLLKGNVSEIDGRVDGAGSVTLDEKSQVFEGGLAVQDARLYLNVIGEEISSLNAIAKFDRTGIFRIENAAGKVGSGEFKASATGRMQGLLFMGVDATLVASKDGIPISSEGATFADATGEIRIAAKMSDDRKALLVDVNVPKADVSLPDSTATLQDLDPDPTVTIGVRRQNGKLDTNAVRKHRGGTGGASATASKGSEALVTRLNVVLGNEVHLEGRGLDVTLGGRTAVELADELKVTGRIDLRGGTIEVHNRKFNVDRGTVTFPDGGDPGNPTIVAAAYWDAPDRTRVWVEYAGLLKGGKITLRSEPAYSPNEILSVLLFGRPDPNMAAAGATADKGNAAGGATAVGTGFIAADINRALSEIDKDLDIETDTLSGNRTRTKLGKSFFDRRLKFQLGVAPGRTTYREPDTVYLFLNWQFIPKWSLVGTRGDKGTSIVDVLFQHRY
jgi:autotransporter translocation and assembly factor TamB